MNISGQRYCTPKSPKDNQNFKGLYNNKFTLLTLEKISEHGTSFAAITSFAMAAGVRPLAISLAPDTDNENKQYAISSSIGSAFMKLAVVEAVAIPVENAIKKIDKNPENYLNNQAVKKLMSQGSNSNAYKFATQVIKLGVSFVTAIPKSLLTVALIPVFMDKIFKNKPDDKTKFENNKKYETNLIPKSYNPVFDKVIHSNNPNFKGGWAEKLTTGILNNEKFNNFIVENNFNSTNIARNISMATDVLLTATQISRTKTSKKIDEKRKPALIYNNLIATGISLLGGFALDNAVQKGTQKQVQKFILENKDNPKLSKYIEGINILRPTLIFAAVYYGILPFFTTYIADKIDKNLKEKNT